MADRRRVPRLMLVTDRRRSRLPLPELARRAVEGGVDAIQVREKDLDEGTLSRLVESVRAAVGEQATVLVNGRTSVAAALGLGVHLPELGMSVREARTALGRDAMIGRSVHRPEAAVASEGADYLIAGHVFLTSSKPGAPALGCAGVREIAAAAPCPTLAIGGIEAANVGQVLAAGAVGVAVVSAIGAADDPTAAAGAIHAALVSFLETRMDEGTSSVRVTVNGTEIDIAQGTTVRRFLEVKGYHERLVVVEVNEAIVPRSAFSATTLVGGDRVEIVHFVGGG